MSAMLRDWRMKAPEGAGYAGLEGMNILESGCDGVQQWRRRMLARNTQRSCLILPEV